MVFALLTAAIAESGNGARTAGWVAHADRSIIGVGVATPAEVTQRTSGLDWGKAIRIAYALLRRAVRFCVAGHSVLALEAVRSPALYASEGDQPAVCGFAGILILTCTLVSFFHGSNDGQKGMGLIMLILIGTVPTAYG